MEAMAICEYLLKRASKTIGLGRIRWKLCGKVAGAMRIGISRTAATHAIPLDVYAFTIFGATQVSKLS